jgi:hypothetical protein
MQKLKGIWDLVATVDGPSFRGLNGRFLLRNQRYHERSGRVKGIFNPHEFLSLPLRPKSAARRQGTLQSINLSDDVSLRISMQELFLESSCGSSEGR